MENSSAVLTYALVNNSSAVLTYALVNLITIK